MLSPAQLDQGLAPALQTLRRQCGYSQEALAHAAGITSSAVSKIERGTASPMWNTLTRILGVLKISLAELEAKIEQPEDLASKRP
jgi:transcriptional regulator with XRE-family HTH domain